MASIWKIDDTSIIVCDEIMCSTDNVSTYVTNTTPTNMTNAISTNVTSTLDYYDINICNRYYLLLSYKT